MAITGLVIAPLAAEDAQWHLLVEPRFMRPDVMIPIAGSERTILTPGLVKDGEVTYLDQQTLTHEGVDLAALTEITKRSASAELAKLKPALARDERGVVVFAVLQSDQPVVASTVLAPDFIEKFEPLFGPDLLVAIPNRYRVYVYPALASRFEDTADLVLADYDVSAYRVSQEIFRVTRDGLVAIGTFAPR